MCYHDANIERPVQGLPSKSFCQLLKSKDQRPRHASKCGEEEEYNQYSNNLRNDDLFIKGNCPCQRHCALIFPNHCCGFQRARGPRWVDVLTARTSMFVCYVLPI